MKKPLLLCGMFASLVYVGTVILGGLIRPGYSHLSEAISELVADGAPNRSLLSSLFLVYNVLLSAFGIGLFFKAKERRRARIMGSIGSWTLILVGMAGISMELVFPQDPGGIPTTVAGTMHLVMAGFASLGTMIAVLLLALWFRNFGALSDLVAYSWFSVVIIFLSGGLTAAAMVNYYPLFGVIERVTIGTFILWLFVISRRMLQLENIASRHTHVEMVGSVPKGR
ncbi:MAG TPA: DUF998 domain-containing protein [Anaerolineales bacterium]|nr:DUF998 domain-containing protein [Anaerolineales bacterium]